ncbi:MaoC family dehydratase N-terminal domain-containing protein [Pseudarthrobacter sp. lyk4-40-TYG-27]|jgi:hypothetical protein|uniref:FAS1-like dehydratase domain-containing protein n=1 Tax=Pseudarthrobacter sp. lyk4-40-TYG-27 TaxID=3040305 RepID=UPI00255710BF|nr:MaoC family dehydratase N-terminal domain-containing protein [Pseudarthrobacter sp. lyk4-40-TYG-27]
MISSQMAQAQGAVLATRTAYPIDASSIRRWAIAVYWPETPPERFLCGRPLLAPEEFNPFAWAVAAAEESPNGNIELNDPDRLEKLLGLPPLGLTVQLNGGVEMRYLAPMQEGDVITSVNRLARYAEREGRRGPMLLSTTEDTWTNQEGRKVLTSTMTLIRY